MASAGNCGGFRRSRAARKLRMSHLARRLASERAACAELLFNRRHRLPAKFGEQRDDGFLDQRTITGILVFASKELTPAKPTARTRP